MIKTHVVMYESATKTTRYKVLWYMFTLLFVVPGLLLGLFSYLGEKADKINSKIIYLRDDFIKRVFLYFNWEGVYVTEYNDDEDD